MSIFYKAKERLNLYSKNLEKNSTSNILVVHIIKQLDKFDSSNFQINKIILEDLETIYEELGLQQNIKENLEKLNKLKENDIKDSEIEELRKDVTSLLLQDKRNNKLEKTVHITLLALAEFKPINPTDPVTLEKIDTNDVVYSSTGHQFSLDSLIKSHNARAYRGTELKEQDDSKYLLNTCTNIPFEVMDQNHIIKCAEKKDYEIKDLKIKERETFLPTLSHEEMKELFSKIPTTIQFLDHIYPFLSNIGSNNEASDNTNDNVNDETNENSPKN